MKLLSLFLGLFLISPAAFALRQISGEVIVNSSTGVSVINVPAAALGAGVLSIDGSGNLSSAAAAASAWGSITGTLSNQLDLQAALNAKRDNDPSALTALGFASWATGDIFDIYDVSASALKKTTVADFDGRYVLQTQIDTDGTLAANSDALVPSQKAVRTYVTAGLALKENLLVNSAGLIAALSDETGTGLSVFSISPALTGSPTAPTQAANDNSTKLATTAYADTGLALKQNLLTNSAGLAAALSDETGTGFAVFSADPALTGSPTAPTQSANDNSTKIATTAYADAKVLDSIADADTARAPSRNSVFDALALKQNIGTSVKHVGPGREYTTIQSALTAIGDATTLAENTTPVTVIVDGGVYDEALTIPKGRIIALLSNGTVILGDGLGANWSSSNSRSITWDTAAGFGANAPKPALLIGALVPSDSTTTFIAQSSGWRISGGLTLGGDGTSHTLVLSSVEINAAVTKSDASLLNVIAERTYFKGAVNWSSGSVILQRMDHCQFDALVTVDGYNEIRNSEIKAGMTVATNFNTLPPSGFFNTTFTGTFTGPANSLKLDSVSNYFFILNAASLGGSATKVVEESTPGANVTNVAAGNISSTTAQTAINELDSEKQALLVNSAGLASALSDETGTGFAVFSISPALTGSPTAPTQTASDNSTKLATTAYVDSAVTAGAGIDSLGGLTTATQLFANGSSGTAPAFVSAVATHTLNIPLASGAGVTSGTISKTDYDSFVAKQSALVNSAGLAGALSDETGTGFAVFSISPALTGSPTAPTQTASDNSTKIATTAYVDTAISAFSSAPTVQAKNANFTAANNFIYIVTGAVDVQLPAPTSGRSFWIKKTASSTVNLLQAAAENIDGVAATRVLTSTKESVHVVADGTDWWLI